MTARAGCSSTTRRNRTPSCDVSSLAASTVAVAAAVAVDAAVSEHDLFLRSADSTGGRHLESDGKREDEQHAPTRVPITVDHDSLNIVPLTAVNRRHCSAKER